MNYREKRESRKKIEQEVGDKIWSIPVKLECSDYSCRAIHDLNFSLDSREFRCRVCGKQNKIFIKFLTILKENTANE